MKKALGPFAIAMINVVAIASLKNLPFAATYGFSLILLYALAAIMFFVPVALVCTELVTNFPEGGGVYLWVKEAFGKKWGFLAIWLQWLENVFWYPSILSFIAVTFATLFKMDLAHNAWFVFVTVLVVFWASTWVNLRGIKLSSKISSFGALFGTLLPTAFIALLGIIWYLAGEPIKMEFNFSLLPHIKDLPQLALLSGIILSFVGMEMSEVHAEDVRKPKKSFPQAILLSTILIFLVNTLGSLSIASVIPPEKLNLVGGVIDAYSLFFKAYKMEFLEPIVGALIIIGAIASVSTWIIGPSRGLLVAAQDGNLPKIFHKVNEHNSPKNILIFQGIVVTVLSSVFLFMPSVNSSFWMLTVMTAQLYLIMYILLFLAAMWIRLKQKRKLKGFKIPFKNYGIAICVIFGIIASIFGIVVGFFPPDYFSVGSLFVFDGILVAGIILGCFFPFAIHWTKKYWK